MAKTNQFRMSVMLAAIALTAVLLALTGIKPAEAAFPGTNGKIAFHSHRDQGGSAEIYTVNADGSSPTRLTDNSAFDGKPALSPDGKKIAFRSDRDGNAEIWVINADGSGTPTQLTSTASGLNDTPTWSPDGTKIAFQTTRDGDSEIYIMNADGSGTPTNFTNNSAAQESDPTWSPDGSRIAFVADPIGGANSEIWVMNVDGSGGQQVTSNPTGHDTQPSWSPDGAQIAFTSNRNTGAEIWVVGFGGGTETRLVSIAQGNGQLPAWSPDGTKIAFVSGRIPSSNVDIWVMDADGGGQQLLATAPGDDIWPDWGVAVPDDTTPPNTTIDVGPSGPVSSTSATFEFSSDEPGSTFWCSLVHDQATFRGTERCS